MVVVVDVVGVVVDDESVEVVVVVVVAVAHTSMTSPAPSVETTAFTQTVATSTWSAPPSVQEPPWPSAVVNFVVDFDKQAATTGALDGAAPA